MKNQEASDVVDILADFTNNYSCDTAGFVDQLTNRTHRTIQQNVFRLMCECIKAWGLEGNTNYDGRNEATITLCKDIVKTLGDRMYLPLI